MKSTSLAESACCSTSCCDREQENTFNKVLDADALRQQVRDDYAKVAEASNFLAGHDNAAGCCAVSNNSALNTLISTRLGYSEQELADVPEGADMGLGCGNPKAIAALKANETVLDLGSGGGFDCFLSAAEVGTGGTVIGVDMTPAMISKSRANAVKGQYANVEFRLGEIEHLPVADDTVDVIISNCVINLSPDKMQVFREAFRVLKAGGRLAISDVVASEHTPAELRNDTSLVSGCIAGAATVIDLESILNTAGFQDIRIQPKDESREFIRDWVPGRGLEDYYVSATIEAVKPDIDPS